VLAVLPDVGEQRSAQGAAERHHHMGVL